MIVFLTVIAVSVDAYLAGLGYDLHRRMRLGEVLYVASFTFFVCLIAFTLNAAYVENLPFVKEAGALIFIGIGAKNYLGSAPRRRLLPEKKPKELWLLGVAVSVDAGLASLTLAIDFRFAVLYAFAMFAAHFLFLLLGSLTARLSFVMEKLSAYSGVFLIALGVTKLLA